MTPSVAIVGGGPAGLALAGMLERHGIDFVVYEREGRDTPPRGGCLDLHRGSGQRAMREAGCFDEMRKYGRLGDATVAQVWDHQGNKVFSWGEGRDAPELDRWLLKKALLTTIAAEKILWQKPVSGSTRDERGQIVLQFSDGSTASGFKLVVGADGTWSKTRHLVTDAVPRYTKYMFWTSHVSPGNSFYPNLEKIAGEGPMVVLGRCTKIWNQRQGDGRYRIDLGFERPEEWVTNPPVDLADTEAVKKLMLQDEFFGLHFPEVKQMISAMEGPFRPWPLYYMPPEKLKWPANSDVTLIGDAAHATPPFVGDGVNCALRDSIILAQKLKEFGVTSEAVAEYEKEMLPYAIDVIERSIIAGDLFFDRDSPGTFFEAIQKRPLFGHTDDW